MHDQHKIEKVIYYRQRVSYPVIFRPIEKDGSCYLEVPDFDIHVYSSSKLKAVADAKRELKKQIIENYKEHVKLPAASFLARPYDVYKYGDVWSSITVTIDIPFEVWGGYSD